ncbi:AAA family ATPase [Cytophagaceae bacterium ABcell3]|nr:AAA family ATPase [Cytophagaceae bacterium ABcell3]
MITSLEIKGYKSIKEMRLELKPVNVLIGSNGSGKSNFISFFKFLSAVFKGQLQRFIIEHKTDNILYFGRKTTESLFGRLEFCYGKVNTFSYSFRLDQDKEGGLVIQEEGVGYNPSESPKKWFYHSQAGYESKIQNATSVKDRTLVFDYVKNVLVYHFHDTSSTSYLRRSCDITDNKVLKPDGRNLPAFLYDLKIKHPVIYKRIIKTVQSVAPYIYDLILEPGSVPGKESEIELRWIDASDLESNFSAYQFSDGTLRFIALATLLLQPDPPSVIIVDEPELGLHPMAISKLAGMVQSASAKAQVIVSTQSVNLVDCFAPEDIITVDRDGKGKQSIFNRLDPHELEDWLKGHSLGELWSRNIINSAQPFTK